MENLINNKFKEVHELRAFLTGTDYKVTKAFEGYPMSEPELKERHEARLRIAALDVEIAELQKDIEASPELQEGETPAIGAITSQTTVEEYETTTNYYKDGVLLKTEITYKKNPIAGRVESIETATAEVIQTLDDPRALKIASAYPEWEPGEAVIVSDKRKRGELLYRCAQAHTTQADWTPETTPALWVKIAAEGTIPDFIQPTGAHDAYQIGDKVNFNGNIYESLINANTYSPTAYPAGWKKL